ncbi:dihydrofolate reductase [Enterococcus sp. DIV1059_2]|uniref:dihydrofolate reductase n=1 Tax=Enterococcus sp. DIV1059_2 TaxID=2774664 RepID=UPI003F23689B
MLKLIAAMDEGRGIGLNNKLLYKSKLDMNRFKTLTEKGIVVYGFNTFSSLPNGPLSSRRNILWSERTNELPYSQVEIMNTKEILSLSENEDVWVIGGENTYLEFIDFADEIELTIFEGQKKADTFFPGFELFFEETTSEKFEDETVNGTFINYKKMEF